MKRVMSVIWLSMLLCLGIFLTGCLPRIDHNHVRKVHLKNHQPTTTIDHQANLLDHESNVTDITVWIHGTRLFSKPMFQEFFENKPCLKPVSSLPDSSRLKKVTLNICQKNPERFPAHHFYIFGWSGQLNFQERYQTAKALYQELVNLCHEYRSHSLNPRIRLITHSHGGNVALNLAYCKGTDSDLYIEELILLACPVQAQTKHLIYDPIFKKITSLYSSLDIIQIIDPQGLYHNPIKSNIFFSERRFPSCDKLHQVKIHLNNRALTHYEFTDDRFLEHLPTILDEVSQWHYEDQLKGIPRTNSRLLCLVNSAKN